ncbi:MAG: C25 family cysteine peptidase, partial [Planctomycetota bacterium]
YPLNHGGGTDNPDIKWLLVCKEEAWPSVEPLYDFRNAQGYDCECRFIAPDFDSPEEIKAYVTQLYNSDDLEYVMLIGDAYYSGGPSAVDVPMYYWVNSYSDSWYTMMDGAGDYLADLAIGRIVYDNMTDLQHQITKTMDYLTDPEVSNWAEHSLLVAHEEQYPLKYTQCKEEIRNYSYAIQTPIFEQCYGGAGATNQDVIDYINTYSSGILNYRGHGSQTAWWQWGPTGDFTAAHIAQFTNFDRYFVHFDVCCDNMDFPGFAGDCFSESIMKDEAAAIATMGAIIPSYTIPNHDFDKEFYKAIYDEGIVNIGYASNFANVTVYNQHGSIGQSNIRTYVWLGDACIDAWTNTMQTMAVIHPGVFFLGTSTITINTGLEGVKVCAQNDEVYATGYTDQSGSITLEFIPPPILPGQLTITASMHNYLTYQADIDVIPAAGPYIIYNDCDINDAVIGNNNGQWDFGEMVDLSIEVKNVGVEPAADVTVEIVTEDPLVTIIDGSEIYGLVRAGDSLTVADGFRVEVDPVVEDQHSVFFTLTATAGPDSWESYFSLMVNSPVVAVDHLTILDPLGNNNGLLDPGEDTDFELTLGNEGHCTVENVVVNMTANHPGVTINGNPGTYGTLNPGFTSMYSYNVLADEAMTSAEVTFTLDITGDGEYAAVVQFFQMVGDERNQPSGPDEYGYMAWENYDGGEGHLYNWIEIAPSQGGPGIANGPTSNDETVQIDLPFTFRYYDHDYSLISVCSNGWIGMGLVMMTTSSNSGIPDPVGPPRMMAPFWDDLNPSFGGGEICTYNDVANHRFIVEYYDVAHSSSSSQRETFQVILFDPDHYPTTTGDGIILVQYHTVANANSATFGIENDYQTDGLEYGFNGD